MLLAILHGPILWIIAALLVLGAIAAAVGKQRHPRDALERPWPLEPRRTLLSPPEQVLYRRLVGCNG